jgi:hypothetical protein
LVLTPARIARILLDPGSRPRRDVAPCQQARQGVKVSPMIVRRFD